MTLSWVELKNEIHNGNRHTSILAAGVPWRRVVGTQPGPWGLTGDDAGHLARALPHCYCTGRGGRRQIMQLAHDR